MKPKVSQEQKDAEAAARKERERAEDENLRATQQSLYDRTLANFNFKGPRLSIVTGRRAPGS